MQKIGKTCPSILCSIQKTSYMRPCIAVRSIRIMSALINNIQDQTNYSSIQKKAVKTGISLRRTFYTKFFRTPDYYALDKISRAEYEIVYSTPLVNYIKYAQISISLGCLTAAASVLYHLSLYLYTGEVSVIHGKLETNMEAILAFFSFFGFIYSIAFVYCRVPVRIYYCEQRDEFLILLTSFFYPADMKKLICKSGEMNLYPNPILPSLTGSYCIGKQRLILFENAFKYLKYLNMLLGIKDEGLD